MAEPQKRGMTSPLAMPTAMASMAWSLEMASPSRYCSRRASSVVATVSMSSISHSSNFSWSSGGTSPSSYSPVRVPAWWKWAFWLNKLMIPWKSSPAPMGISTGTTFGANLSLISR